MIAEPACCVALDLSERARLLEQMAGAVDDDEFPRSPEPLVSHAVELDHMMIEAADDQQCRRDDLRQGIPRQIPASAARHDRLDRRARPPGGAQRGAAAGARPEI